MIKLIYFSIPLLTIACSGTSTVHKKEYYYTPKLPEILTQIDTLGVLSLENIQLSLSKACDSCHGASTDFFAFEYQHKLDSLMNTHFPQMTTVELYPGLGRSQDTSVLNSQKEVSLSSYWQQDVLKEFHGVQNFTIPPQMRLALSQIATEYKVRFFLFPIQANIQLIPSNKTSGKIQIQHTIALFDGQKTQLLFQLKDELTHETAGKEQIDRQNTQWLLEPLFKSLKEDLENFSEIEEER